MRRQNITEYNFEFVEENFARAFKVGEYEITCFLLISIQEYKNFALLLYHL